MVTALVCREIRLRQFRNFEALDLHFPHAGAAIIGDNGSGKTNLLEAVHYLEIFRSFRGAADEQLVRFGAAAFHMRGV
ncbi:MAG: AAA family ATPase, partial [Gemmatimonadetes bacterium]|nr:AAA family ATPase [Gemmatimonadota bacterium]